MAGILCQELPLVDIVLQVSTLMATCAATVLSVGTRIGLVSLGARTVNLVRLRTRRGHQRARTVLTGSTRTNRGHQSARTVNLVSTRTRGGHKSVRTVLPATMRTHRGHQSARVVQQGGTVASVRTARAIATATLLRIPTGRGTLAVITMYGSVTRVQRRKPLRTGCLFLTGWKWVTGTVRVLAT